MPGNRNDDKTGSDATRTPIPVASTPPRKKKNMASTLKSFLDSAKQTISGQSTPSPGTPAENTPIEKIFPKVDPAVDGDDCDHDCASCHVKYPKGFKIDEDDKLYGHVKGWSTHILVATGKSDWVRDVADEKGSVMQAIDHGSVKPSNGVSYPSLSNLTCSRALWDMLILHHRSSCSRPPTYPLRRIPPITRSLRRSSSYRHLLSLRTLRHNPYPRSSQSSSTKLRPTWALWKLFRYPRPYRHLSHPSHHSPLDHRHTERSSSSVRRRRAMPDADKVRHCWGRNSRGTCGPLDSSEIWMMNDPAELASTLYLTSEGTSIVPTSWSTDDPTHLDWIAPREPKPMGISHHRKRFRASMRIKVRPNACGLHEWNPKIVKGS